MLTTLQDILPILACPKCRAPLARVSNPEDAGLRCANGACKLSNFPYVQKQPVLVDFERSVLDEATFAARSGASVHKRDPGRTSFRSRLRRYALGDNEVARRLAVPFIVEVQQLSP